MKNTTQLTSQTITKATERKTIQGSSDYFSGSVTVQPLTNVTEGINATSAYVSFKSNARSFWHTHPKGQYLVITEGEAIVQEWGKPAQKLAIGDVVYCPPNVKHWHGAGCQCGMTHLALTGTDENGKNVEWLEPVSEEQYQQAQLEAEA